MVKSLNKKCQNLTNTVNDLEKEKSNLNEKLLHLEMKSMDHNLVFYGIKEYDGENCEDIVKNQVLKQTLEMDQTTVDNIKIDWANRGGKNRHIIIDLLWLSSKTLKPAER